MPIFYLPVNEDWSVKIRSNNNRIRDLIASNYLLFSGNELNNDHRRDVFLLDIKSSPRRKMSDVSTRSGSLTCALVSPNDSPRYLFSTPLGSFSKIDVSTRYANTSIVSGDPLEEYLIIKAISVVVALVKIIRVHAAWVKNSSRSFLLIGGSGFGKTTIAKMISGKNKKLRILEEDKAFLISTGNKIYGFSPIKNTCLKISHLFFLDRRADSKTKIAPITKKEAFKRIVFHSDIIFHKKDAQADYRVGELSKIVSQCSCFLLINGNDLIENPDNINRLITARINNVK